MCTVVRASDVRPRRRGPRAAAAAAGFSLVELLVIVAIVVILFSIFVPYAMKMREAERRGRCADNLRAIGYALSQYAAHRSGPNGHDYPRVAFDPTRPGYTVCTGADSADPFALEAADHPAHPSQARPVEAVDQLGQLRVGLAADADADHGDVQRSCFLRDQDGEAADLLLGQSL